MSQVVHVCHPSFGHRAVEVGEAEVVIGRAGAGVDVEIDGDRLLSRRHGRMWGDREGVWYQDLDSRNGSYSGGLRLQAPVLLAPGTEVLLSEVRICLAPVAEPAAAKTRAPPSLTLPPGMELRFQGRVGGEGLTQVLTAPSS